MACILYVIAVGTLLGIAALLIERTLPSTTTSRRWLWCAVIALNVALPPIYNANHRSSITDVLEEQAVQSGIGHTLASASVKVLDDGLSARILGLDPMIQRYWLFTSALLVLWGLATTVRISALMRRSRRPGEKRHTGVIDGFPVVITNSIGPATVGVLRSRVVVPRWVLALPGPQRRYVLRHEEEHRKSHDSLLLFVASLSLILMPWNLAFWWNLRRLRLAVEMDCDARVVSALGNPSAYGELLFKVAQASNRGPRLQPAFLGSGMLERRLTALLAPTQLKRAQRFLLPIIACILLFIVLKTPHPMLSRSHDHTASTTTATMKGHDAIATDSHAMTVTR